MRAGWGIIGTRLLRVESHPKAAVFIDARGELILYLRLSQAYKGRHQLQDRDKALVIGGACASMMQMPVIAKFCRSVVLQRNRGHMLKRWDSFSEAIQEEDFQSLLKQLRRKISAQRALELLEEFQYHCPVKIADHRSNESFAAAVLGIEYQWLQENFGDHQQ